jgi:hypothetical protein
MKAKNFAGLQFASRQISSIPNAPANSKAGTIAKSATVN